MPAVKERMFCWTGRDRFEFLSPCNSYSSRCLVRTSQNTWYPEKNEATGSLCITSANSNASLLLFGNQWHREYDAELLIWYHDVLFTWQNVATLPCKMKRHIITLQHRNRQSVRKCVGLLELSLAATTVVINSMLESETVLCNVTDTYLKDLATSSPRFLSILHSIWNESTKTASRKCK